jgi:hypothetical protein
MIGDTLFIDGTPYTVCGRCELPIKSSDGNHEIRIRNGRKVREIKSYKILMGKIRKIEEITTDDQGHPVIREKWELKLFSKPGCFDCWTIQDRDRQAEGMAAKREGRLPQAVYYRI